MGDWSFFLRDTGGGETYLHWMMTAWGWTLAVAVLALIVALLVGSLMGILRTTPSKLLVAIGNGWTELFRNIPLLVQIFLWYHVIPSIFLSLRAIPSFMLVVFAIGFFTSARISEQVRAGIQSLPRGQRDAGLAMGFTLPQVYRFVLLPMGYRLIIPPMTSEFLTIFKNSSTALTIGVLELTAQSRQISEYTFKTFEAFTAATLIYVVITLTVIYLMRWLEGRLAVPGYISQAAGGH